MANTQDMSFGLLWVRIAGDAARWEVGDERARLGATSAITASDPAGLVAVWIAGDGPVLMCKPAVGVRALRALAPGADVEAARAALRAAGAVVSEDAEPLRDSSL